MSSIYSQNLIYSKGMIEETKFKEMLKQIRKENNVSQKTLAEKLSTTLKTISHWETGYSEPSLKQLAEISIIFQISVDELLGLK